jgi:DNA (cytosine-5)-methyltransferase 1
VKFVSLFAGIGGLDLGLERAGHECILQVEIDPFCQKVLAKHWPAVRRIADVRDVTAEDCEGADMIVGGFPCQPVSTAGRRLGQDDERWLWPEYERILGLVRPRVALVENVSGLFTRGFDDVITGLAALGYDAEWDAVSACSMGAPHMRRRVFIVAYAAGVGSPRPWITRSDGAPHSDWEASHAVDAIRARALPVVCGEDHGVSARMDRLRSLGNAVVPQVAEWIGRRLPQ